MVAHFVSRTSTAIISLALLLVLPGCGGNGGTTAPAPDPNAALMGNWIGTSASGDSIWVAFLPGGMDFHMTRAAGADSSLSPATGVCFTRYPSALNRLADPNVSFRVNFQSLGLGSAETLKATRSGNTLTAVPLRENPTPYYGRLGTWTAQLCATCPTSSVITALSPDTLDWTPVRWDTTRFRIRGTNFTTCSVARIDDVRDSSPGSDRRTTFVSPTELIVNVSLADTAGTKAVTVFTPSASGGESNGLSLTIRRRSSPEPGVAGAHLNRWRW